MVKQKLSCTLELYCEKSSFKRPLFFIHNTRRRERESAFYSRRIILTAFMTANISLCWSTLAPRQNYKLTHLFFWKSPHCLVLQNLFFALQSLISSFIQSPKTVKKSEWQNGVDFPFDVQLLWLRAALWSRHSRPQSSLGSGSRRLSSGQLSDAAPHTFSLGSLF